MIAIPVHWSYSPHESILQSQLYASILVFRSVINLCSPIKFSLSVPASVFISSRSLHRSCAPSELSSPQKSPCCLHCSSPVFSLSLPSITAIRLTFAVRAASACNHKLRDALKLPTDQKSLTL